MDSMKPKSEGKKHSLKKKLVVLAGIAATILLVSGGVWLWQQTKLDEQVDKNASLASSNKQLNKKQKALSLQLKAAENENTALNKKVTSLKKENSLLQSPEQANISVSVGSVQHNKVAYNESGTDLLYVDLVVKNNSNIEGYFSPAGLQLKDSSNKIHPLCENSAIGYYVCQTGLSLPKGRVELKDVALRAGETANGTVGFYVPKTINAYTLRYGDQEIQINTN